MVTRKDVASYAGVSPATVSNVINNKDMVSDKLRQRVLEAVEILNYQPNMVARSLKTKATMQIALVGNDITNEYYGEVALGMEQTASKAGYVVCTLNARNDKDYVNELVKRQFDGIIMATDKIPVDNLNYLAQWNIPTVFIGNQEYVGIDKRITQIHIKPAYNGACRLFKYLIGLGHRRIGFISARMLKNISDGDYRLKAYLDTLKEAQIDIDDALVYWQGGSLEYAYDATAKMLKGRGRPSAIFAGNDNQALAVLAAAKELGFGVPCDLSVAGFDNIKVSKYYTPPLTTVDMPKSELGEKAVEVLLKRINDKAVKNCTLDYDTHLIIRSSTGMLLE
ncbi:MAG: LacI family DNA-binding transcriptional regulator [Mahellales bacterium]|jgi:DNA-binding LacI/PurR family transcriptional regulator